MQTTQDQTAAASLSPSQPMPASLQTGRNAATAIVLALLLTLGACGGGGDSVIAPAAKPAAAAASAVPLALARVSTEPVGLHCAAGGARIDAGIDSNGNRLLDNSEISTTQYVCNGAVGAAGATGATGLTGPAGLTGGTGAVTLMRLDVEAPGANCQAGGTKVSAGLDANANGVLDNAEVSGTPTYVCGGAPGVAGANGTNGTDGSNGLSMLMRIDVEAPGVNCAAGGTKVSAGLDANANGVLDASEISGTARYVCNGSTGATGATGNNGTNGTNGVDAVTTLMRLDVEAPGANCVAGGTKVSSGLDANGNGLLDNAEVSGAPRYVCNGAAGAVGGSGADGSNGLTTVMRVDVEAAGANCSAGGIKISAGLDANRDGLLDNGEASGVPTYVCTGVAGAAGINGTNGTNGSNGTNGHSSLMSMTAEAAGVNCQYGGTKVTAGVDSNGDGVLTAGEVTSTSYNCNGAPGAGVTWINVTGTTQQAVSGLGYLADNASMVTVTLPTSPSIGDLIEISGIGAGGWTIAQNAGQSILVKGLQASYASFGAAWTAHPSVGADAWQAVASSADGNKLLAVVAGGDIYTSTDAGITWLAHNMIAPWGSVASSSDGTKLVGVQFGGQIYTSTDSGATWTARDSNRSWLSVASSADGIKLVAAEYPGHIYTSTDSGVSWTARDSNRNWYSVTSSADGGKLAAVDNSGFIYTSTDAGVTWTPRESARNWEAITSSADGNRLVAGDSGGLLYTSGDAGITWTARDNSRGWISIASSADGGKLVALEYGGRIYTSIDAGVTWTPRESVRNWQAVASSTDGSKLVAVVDGDVIYTSINDRTTVGVTGSLVGGQFDAIALQYIGGGLFIPLSDSSFTGEFGVN